MASNSKLMRLSWRRVGNLIRRRGRQGDGYGIAKVAGPYDYTALCHRSSANEWRGVHQEGRASCVVASQCGA